MILSRRRLLRASAASAAALGAGWPRRARASGSELKFIFVCNHGGWDSTRVFLDGFDNDGVDMEGDAERATSAGLSWIDHPARPSVRSFFEAHAARTALLKGFAVRSISHDVCMMLTMSGVSSGLEPDWGAILGDAARDRYPMPHLVAGGFSFPGSLGVTVSRTGTTGQLQSLLDGSVLNWNSENVDGPNPSEEALLDAFANRRIEAAADATRGALAQARMEDLRWAASNVAALKETRWSVDLSGGRDISEQIEAAVAALGLGLSRCASLGYPEPGPTLAWDTHQDNDPYQSDLFEGLFAGLNQLMSALESWPGEHAATLADETVVVVVSEMDRTPLHNNLMGKDHWPYATAMITGPGITGGRSIGAYDPESWFGSPVDPDSGELYDGGTLLSAEHLGATLMALGDVDPGIWLPGISPLYGALL